MTPILITATKDGLRIESEYNKARVQQMVKDGTTLFQLTPRVRASKKQIGYFEGAVIPCYAEWQYGLNPRDPKNHEIARNLFKQDFHYEIVKDRNGNPKKTIKSLKNCQAEVLNKYTELAPENGMPIPNEKLYLTWRDEWSMDTRFQNFYDWLDFLGIDQDTMPSAETLAKLK